MVGGGGINFSFDFGIFGNLLLDGKRGASVVVNRRWLKMDGFPVTSIDDTGAGDAFGSGFVAALIHGKDVNEAIDWGRKQAANVVKFIGAKKGLMTADNF